MLKLVQLIIKMFNNGLLDHISNFQSILEKIYIKHRALDYVDLKYAQNLGLEANFLGEIK